MHLLTRSADAKHALHALHAAAPTATLISIAMATNGSAAAAEGPVVPRKKLGSSNLE